VKGKILVPEFGNNGIRKVVNLNEGEFCTYWLQGPEGRTWADKLWFYLNNITNAEVTVYEGLEQRFVYTSG